MAEVSIPDWNAQGVIPPIDVSAPTSLTRSPYLVTLTDFVLKFATSPERKKILDGFLRFRAALHGLGLTSGFQWVDGSFLENVELLATLPPKDIDVVTYFALPTDVTEADLLARSAELFN